jgi:hypothetical protein
MADHELAGAKVLLSANCPNGDELALVMYDDDSCGITRNGQVEPAWIWNPCQMPEATKGLMELAALSGRALER